RPAKSQPPGPEDELAMRDQERRTRPVVVPLPAEIDNANAEHAGEQLGAAFAPAVTAVMGLRVFCCTFGSRQLVAAHKRAMSWLTNPEPGIGNCRRSNHVRRNSGSRL